nr:MAG TPA: hypothetical protein [Bacteriophage sp.]DAY99016.1 MAG TPA: hypothetical protein [Caudoviricetes sp.]
MIFFRRDSIQGFTPFLCEKQTFCLLFRIPSLIISQLLH